MRGISDRSQAPVHKEPLFAGDPRLKTVIAAASIAVFTVALDFFSVQAAIPEMADDLGTSASALQWVISGYLLAAAAFLIVGGRVADIFGRRRVLVVGSAVFGLSALAGGAADSAGLVIAMRLVQGAASAFMVPVALAVTTNAFPPQKVQRAVGLVFGLASTGQAVGPVAGGLLTQVVSWRAVLWINVPIAVAVIALTLAGVDESRDESVPKSIDAFGLSLVVSSIAAFTYGIDRAADWGWAAGSTIALIVGGLVGLAGFAVAEIKVRYPLLDLRLFRVRAFSAMTLAGSVANAAATVAIFFSMLYFQDIRGFTASEAGIAFLTFSLGFAIAGALSGRFEEVEPWMVMAGALAIAGVGVIGMGVFDQLGAFIALATLGGFGTGLGHDYASVITQAIVPPGQVGSASGTVLAAIVSAGGLGLAIAVSIFDSAVDGGTSEETVIRALLIGVGCVCAATAALVAVTGRKRTPRTKSGT